MSFILQSMRSLCYCLPLLTGIAHAETYVNTAGSRSSATYTNGSVSVSGDGVVIINGKVISGDAVIADGPAKTETRSLLPYDSLQINAPVMMTYEVSGQSSLKVTAPENVLPMLSTSVINGRLTVDFKRSVASLNAPIRIDASGPGLQSVTISGTGSADLMNLSGTSVDLNVSGSSEISATGNVARLTATVSGSGRINAPLLQAEEINLDASGAGNISAFASRAVVGDLSGASRATIAGAPAHRKVAISGAANIAFP